MNYAIRFYLGAIVVLMLTCQVFAQTSLPKALPNLPPDELIGTWRQVDDGRYLQISQSTADFFDYSKTLCYRVTPDSGKQLSGTYSLYSIGEEGKKLKLWKHDFGARFEHFYCDEFVRVDELPSHAIFAPEDDPRFKEPEFILNLIIQQFDEHFPFFEQRNFNWTERKEKMHGMVRENSTDEQLFDSLCEMLAGLGDSHTRIYWKKRNEPFKSGRAKILDALEQEFGRQEEFDSQSQFNGNWSRNMKSSVEALLLERKIQVSANGKFRWGILKGNVGYLENSALSGFSPTGTSRPEEIAILESELDGIIGRLKDCKAIILDLSFNGGGYDAAAMVIASRFADKRRHVMSVSVAGQTQTQVRKCFVSPAGPHQFNKPVFVLTSDVTVSAGEALVLMLKAFPQVTHVGEPTRGCLSGILNKWMPNDFHLTLSNQIWTSPDGTPHEGKGIQPELSFPVFANDELFESYPKAIRKALHLITETERVVEDESKVVCN